MRFKKGHKFLGDINRIIAMNKARKGKPLLEEHKRKIGEGNKGKIHTSEQNKRTSETTREAMKNPKIRFKISKAKKGKRPWNYIDGKRAYKYGDDWEKIRFLIYCRDKFICQDCGVNGISLDVHHKIPFLISFDNSLNNLIALCRSCHTRRDNIWRVKLLKNGRTNKN